MRFSQQPYFKIEKKYTEVLIFISLKSWIMELDFLSIYIK